MADIKFLPIPAEDYDALGITADTVLQTYLTDDGVLVVRAVTDEDLESFSCDGDCETCPVAQTECDGECFSCPCYANCEDSDFTPPKPEGVCKSHGNRRDNINEGSSDNEQDL